LAIHPTAIVDPKAALDPTVEVGPYCVIDGDVRIDAGCRLINHVYVTGHTHVREGCVLHPGAVVGHEPQDVKFPGERSYCEIGAGTIIREHVTIHRGTDPESTTTVGAGCFLLAGSHVAHNCTLGDRVTLINNALLAGHVAVGDGVTFGGGAGVHQFVRIGELAMVAGNARVPMDIVPFAMVDPAGHIAGLNRIGLRRAGCSRAELEEIRNAYRILFESNLKRPEAIERLRQQVTTDPGKRLLHFVTSDSRRGLAGGSRLTAEPDRPQPGPTEPRR
jgi:UDP-N-acetylglucosamine acyltransferase